ncbi:hypothetical protein HDU87_003653 [Geranomyces variabilis]|uniref:Uncharacterized protein n=1 Tax=Geranomyces variabilis TaxID=109894 RepID=A0AAD5TJN8_9FUNG|nr:hypothetical protein HDU87_003653 [Geranomyces variabilis]
MSSNVPYAPLQSPSPQPSPAPASASAPAAPHPPSSGGWLPTFRFFTLWRRRRSPTSSDPPPRRGRQEYISILRLLVISALLFALIPVLALVAALVPPPGPAIITGALASVVFPAAAITLWLAIRRMRAEEERVRLAADQLEMGPGGALLPRYVDVEQLPAYEGPKEDESDSMLIPRELN